MTCNCVSENLMYSFIFISFIFFPLNVHESATNSDLYIPRLSPLFAPCWFTNRYRPRFGVVNQAELISYHTDLHYSLQKMVLY
jgi:hypothetical protein